MEEKPTLIESLLYKLDRTLCVIGIVAIGLMALSSGTPDKQVVIAAISGLVGYLGGRTGSTGK